MRHLETADDPLTTLEELNRLSGDTTVRMASSDHLKVTFASDNSEPNQIVFAIAACAHLRCSQVRDDLLALCDTAYQRVISSGDLPEAEEHFAMAAIRALDMPHARFSSIAVYDEYEAVVAQASKILERDGEAAARKLVRALAKRYKVALATLLGRSEPVVKASKPKSKDRSSNDSKDHRRGKGERVNLMEGYEFPNVEDVVAEESPPDIASSFQPFMTTSDKHDVMTAAPPRDAASLDLFQVTTLPEGSQQVPDTGFRAEMSMPASGSIRTVLMGSGVLAILAGLLLGILGFRISPLLSAAGILWFLGGVGLLGGKPGGWRLGMSAYLIVGVSVIVYTLFGTLPKDILPIGMYLIGAISMAIGGGLTHGSIREQLGRKNRFD
jgi:hypothetical protein